jgi:hypothetical protein
MVLSLSKKVKPAWSDLDFIRVLQYYDDLGIKLRRGQTKVRVKACSVFSSRACTVFIASTHPFERVDVKTNSLIADLDQKTMAHDFFRYLAWADYARQFMSFPFFFAMVVRDRKLPKKPKKRWKSKIITAVLPTIRQKYGEADTAFVFDDEFDPEKLLEGKSYETPPPVPKKYMIYVRNGGELSYLIILANAHATGYP